MEREVLGRLGRVRPELTGVIWRVDSAERTVSGDWIVAADAAGSRVGEDVVLILGMRAEELDRRAIQRVKDRLARIGRERCEGILIEKATLEAIKAGGPFHRLMQMRDQGIVQLFLIEAADASLAEWMVEQTPVDAVVMPYGIMDQGVAYRALGTAEESGVAVIGGPVRAAMWNPSRSVSEEEDLAFVAGERRVAGILREMPKSVQERAAILSAIERPMSDEQRRWWWEEYQKNTKPPVKLGRHPPAEEL